MRGVASTQDRIARSWSVAHDAAHWLAAALFVSGTSVVAEPSRGPNRMETEIVPSQIDNTTITDEVAIGRDIGDRMTVSVSVSGQGPYRFLVDTGAERTVISRELAHRLRLEDGKDAILHSVMGANDVNTVPFPICRSATMSFRWSMRRRWRFQHRRRRNARYRQPAIAARAVRLQVQDHVDHALEPAG